MTVQLVSFVRRTDLLATDNCFNFMRMLSACMRNGGLKLLLVFLEALCALVPTSVFAQDESWKTAIGDGNQRAFDLREEVVSIPQVSTTLRINSQPLIGTLFQPAGDGPHPVIVLSHGSPGRATDRKLMGRYRVIPQIRALVDHGFAVLVPIRRGYGDSTAEYAESFGPCHDPSYEKTGEESARDIRAAIAYARTRSSLDSSKIVLMGQSAGGFASIAAASMGLNGVVAVVNLSGGRGGNGINGLPCRPDRMAEVIARYSTSLRVPVLWFYVENDKYFGPAASRSWFSAFESVGGKGRLIIHPPYGDDGHLLFYKTMKSIKSNASLSPLIFHINRIIWRF
jgi:dienelactone hydrolase